MFVGACGAPFTGGVCPRVFQRCMGVQLFALFVERGDGKIFPMDQGSANDVVLVVLRHICRQWPQTSGMHELMDRIIANGLRDKREQNHVTSLLN